MDFMKNKSLNDLREEEPQDQNQEPKEDTFEKLAELEELNELKNKIPKFADIHDKDISIVFRNFVELILVVA